MAMAAPGGDADDAIGRQLNPFKRKRDKPVVYWSGIVDVNGDTRLSYTVPDYFNGKLRVMVCRYRRTRVRSKGRRRCAAISCCRRMCRRHSRGDEADVSVGVANNLTGVGNQPVPVAVTLKTGPQLRVIRPATQNVALAPQHEGVAMFRVKATDTLGSGLLSFGARYGAKGAHSVDVRCGRPRSARSSTSHASIRARRRACRTWVDVRRVCIARREHLDRAARVRRAVVVSRQLRAQQRAAGEWPCRACSRRSGCRCGR